MKVFYRTGLWFVFLALVILSCSGEDAATTKESADRNSSSGVSPSLAFDSPSGSSSSGSSSSGNGQGGAEIDPGQITAGEWNDLENWNFWEDLLKKEDYADFPEHWEFYTANRYSVTVKGFGGQPIIDAEVELIDPDGNIAWLARTDNKGQAELFSGLFNLLPLQSHQIKVYHQSANAVIENAKPFNVAVNEVNLSASGNFLANAEVAFVVDATGSMGDEMEYLKVELNDIIAMALEGNPSLELKTGSVFYRDNGDEYLTKTSPLTSSHSSTIEFINLQKANGGGDYPEAVEIALNEAMAMSWSENAVARIIFLVLDAPPHHEPGVISSLQETIRTAAAMGVKVIPVTASGINKNTEFLMRFLSMATNGTYVFITDHSGIGNAHLEPTVGDYEVEYLNELLARLIKEYSEI